MIKRNLQVGRNRMYLAGMAREGLIGDVKEISQDKTWGKNVLYRENSSTKALGQTSVAESTAKRVVWLEQKREERGQQEGRPRQQGEVLQCLVGHWRS